ncbi:ASKHA domain-containing protein [Neomoorella humiferrea]|uniref:Ferredoxin n=1 Tax=Neomoorella humiferrea TaxID=676965 RepID=A0A2T0AM45_9FIRM|nr:ASKHA domain-containing protein [Moorella humiferrea]PRR69804.1 Ferredoxin [Moorella humiferrea]
MNQYTVTFMPDNIAVQVDKGTNVLEAAQKAGIPIKSTCGGAGTCGRCLIKVKEGQIHFKGGHLSAEAREEGYFLACQTIIEGDVIVEVPPISLLGKHQVLLQDKGRLQDGLADLPASYSLDPHCEIATLHLKEPTLEENNSDLNRLLMTLRKEKGVEGRASLKFLQDLPEILRQAGWHVDVTLARADGRLLKVSPAGTGRCFGLAVDLGTTTIVVSLLDLLNGRRIGRNGNYNRQAIYGDDVISRVIHATGQPGGLEELRQAALTTISEITSSLLNKYGIAPAEVTVAAVAGNTIMSHLLLGVNPKYIRLQPYIPAANEWPDLTAGEIGLPINPLAPVYVFPSVASYVGGDIVAGVLFTRLAMEENLTLFIDIGTNGEMVLGNKDWLISCACSAGPAFEGSGITCGMRAMEGAIEGVNIDPQTFEVELDIIGGCRPAGLCGSGLIDCLAKLRRAGLIDRTGNFQEAVTPRLRSTDEGYEFVLAWGAESSHGKDIVITSADIKNLIRSKGAVFAGIQSLLKTVSLELDAIDKIIIAGGFGNYLSIPNAVEIGLLPDLPAEKYVFAGNTSLKGAELVLLSRQAWLDALELARKMTYIELSVGNLFMEEFVSALFLPHTQLELFPSVTEQTIPERGEL